MSALTSECTVKSTSESNQVKCPRTYCRKKMSGEKETALGKRECVT